MGKGCSGTIYITLSFHSPIKQRKNSPVLEREKHSMIEIATQNFSLNSVRQPTEFANEKCRSRGERTLRMLSLPKELFLHIWCTFCEIFMRTLS